MKISIKYRCGNCGLFEKEQPEEEPIQNKQTCPACNSNATINKVRAAAKKPIAK